MTQTIERHEFQAEAKELLELMIHSVYSNKDIFLRELISNSSDALDKLRIQALTETGLLPADYKARIFLNPDKEAGSFTIEDNGIGMSREEVINVIGTIAKSGTREFMELIRNTKDKQQLASPELIGQFGVGFYSVFMVADRVTMVTRKAGEDKAVKWESSGDGSYTIEDVERDSFGTTITLHLKPSDKEDGLREYTDPWFIKSIVKKYSDFVSYPIDMDFSVTEPDYDDEGKPIPGSEKTVTERETLNSMKAIWTRPESEVTDEEYNEFYKHVSHDWNEPLKRIRVKMEGNFEAQALLFIPSKAPFDIYHQEFRRGIQLYVKRVFIMDECKELMPTYLRFVKGVVDSEDLSLNISREILQQSRQIRAIRNRLVKKVHQILEELRNTDTTKYLGFWNEFGPVVKEGIYEDSENKETVLGLSMFASTASPDELTSVKSYIDRMKPDQEAIYYITGKERHVVENSPHLEAFKEQGYEVLLLTDPVDELWVNAVYEFEGKKFQSVGKGTVELGSEEEKKAAQSKLEEKQKDYKSLFEFLQGKLGEDIKDVRFSTRLKSSPACLVGNPDDMTPQMEQMLRALGQETPKVKRILELNPDHPLIEKLNHVYETDQSSPMLNDYAELLYGQAILAEGGQVPDPAQFSRLVSELMLKTVQ